MIVTGWRGITVSLTLSLACRTVPQVSRQPRLPGDEVDRHAMAKSLRELDHNTFPAL